MSISSERGFKFSLTFVLLMLVVGLIAGGLATYLIAYQQIENLNNDIANLKNQVSKLWGFQNATYQNITIYQNATALTEIYEHVKDSVVLVRGTTSSGTVQGSGFVYNFSGLPVVITNYHVVHGTITVSVTFSNGNGYAAEVNGTDPYADLAVLLVNAPQEEFKPIEIVSSSTLKVGDPVIAIGNPYGLVGSMTTGVISALGRTITEEYTGGFGIANIIQTSAPINPGNSGGPLLNYNGKVIGITTAIVADSQGLGFAIPSNTILREIYSLIKEGTYDGHSYMGVRGTDMNYETSQEMGINVTYGWLIVEVISDGPSDGKLQVNDTIIAMNMTRIKNGDDLASYLEENTLPGDNLIITVVRANVTENVTITLERRPSPFT
ncbi:MAG: trypsin-like peptidase domain-containing protein [Candidatus Bathyarchaeota archaeon]|nr:trypsin-like serine protease [Candidatus Bathyarchaeota archaeon A05DMB-5]MDH7558531.1 trypsin-like peptidase domain-containing protein [Candidatus Bathyarchaeota archaeon]